MASDYYEKFIEEMKKRNPEGFPDDQDLVLPDAVKDQFDIRMPDFRSDDSSIPGLPETALPVAPTPDIPLENTPEPISQAPPIDPSSFDVDVSTTTPRMKGREESLPSSAALSEPAATPERRWELEEDEAVVPSEVTPTSIPAPTPTDTPITPDRETADTALLATGQDEKERARMLAELEKKRKFQVIPQTIAGIGDAISASASAFGGSAPGGSMQRMIERQDKQLAQGKEDIETKLRNDPNSDISKQYQNLLAQMMQKDPSDAAILGLTANQITEKIPTIDRMMQRRSTEDLKRLAFTAKSQDDKFSPARKKFDEEMAKTTAEFTDSGGIKVAKQAVNQLQKSIDSFKKLDPGLLSRATAALSPDAMRGLVQPQYKSIEQEVRQNVTELLRSTLGAQFTEREGERIFSQTFDPTLPMKINLRRMEALRDKLNAIADERARAVQHFAQYGTFKDYEPQSDLNWAYGSLYDGSSDESGSITPRQTKLGHKYSVGP